MQDADAVLLHRAMCLLCFTACATTEKTPIKDPPKELRVPCAMQLDAPGHVSPQVLTLRILCQPPFPDAVRLHVDVPEGASLVAGTVDEEFTRVTSLERNFTVQWETIPEQDLVFLLDVQAEAWSAQSRKLYRFGRDLPPASENR